LTGHRQYMTLEQRTNLLLAQGHQIMGTSRCGERAF